ncbi:MAG: 2-dehydropantoate 2-reductase [Verrucomicrobia bacterium]|nr:2-dehydropantoate 2-reductase [Verrucomicrobiota bacterium]
MTRIAIIGPGSIGGAVALWLEQTGRHDLTLCARRPLAKLSMDSPAGHLEARLKVWTQPAEAEPVDWVLVATKATQAAATALWFPRLVGPTTRVAILQNGVEHIELFSPYLPIERIVPVMVALSSERPAPDHILQRGPGRMVVPDDAKGRDFVALLQDTPIDVKTSSDFKTVVWRKLCGNAPGVINALLLQPTVVMRGEKIGELARALVRECIAVGRAEGAALDDDVEGAVVQALRQAPPDSINSLHADRANGRPMEIDVRNGVIVRLGRKHGIPTPCNAMAVALLEAMQDGSAGPSPRG